MIDYKSENTKLASLLLAKGFQFELSDFDDYGGTQVVLFDSCHRRVADAVCHSFSYGHEMGLLEIMGLGVDREAVGDNVEGWLTAEEVFNRWCDALEGRG